MQRIMQVQLYQHVANVQYRRGPPAQQDAVLRATAGLFFWSEFLLGFRENAFLPRFRLTSLRSCLRNLSAS